MAKNVYTEQVQKQAEKTHRPGPPYRKPYFTAAGTGSTRPAKLRQFVIPGTIDPHYSQPFSERKTEPEVRAIPGAFLDLQATRKMANPPYARNTTTPATTIRQYLMLLQILLAEYRTTWFFHVFGGILIPIGFAFIIIAVGGARSSEKAIYLLGGNMALSIVTGPASFIISKIGSARQTKAFHYWIALPIPKLTLILAIASVAQLFALPGLLGTYVLGSLLLGLSFTDTSWVLLPLALLGSVSLTGLGALLGSIVRDSETANVLSSISIIFVSFLSPVILPLDALPIPLRITALVMPTTYVADAFRAALGGHQGTNMAFDLIILTLFSAVTMIFTYFRLDWRDT